MKKALLIIFTLVFAFTVAACNNESSSTKTNSKTNTTQVVPTTKTSSKTATSTTVDNSALLNEAKEALVLSGVDSVTEDLTLPVTGLNNSTISWESSDETIVTPSGTVNRPAYEEGNKEVTLTATIQIANQSVQKTFTLNVVRADQVALNASLTVRIGIADEAVEGGIKFTAIPKDKNSTVYYVLYLKSYEKPDLATVLKPTTLAISSGNKVGGYTAFAIGSLASSTEYIIYAVAVNGNVQSEIYEIAATSSKSFFYGGQNPTELGYYPIYNLADLEEWGRAYNAGELARTTCLTLMADIDMSETYGEGKKNWSPLDYPASSTTGQDTSGTEYHGVFEGNNHTINGLYCHSSSEYVGFFKKFDTKGNTNNVGSSPSGRILNLTFTNVDVKAIYDENCGRTNGTAVFSAVACGAAVGFFRGGLIENVKVIGGSVTSDRGFVGGIVGFSNANGWQEGRGDVTLTINKCMTDVNVEGENCVGGIIGQFDEGSHAEAREMTLKNCYTLGSTKGKSNVGGIAGEFTGIMENCAGYGTVEGETNVGGICGSVLKITLATPFYETKITNVLAANTNVIATVSDGYATFHDKTALEDIFTNCYFTTLYDTANENIFEAEVSMEEILDATYRATNKCFEEWSVKVVKQGGTDVSILAF